MNNWVFLNAVVLELFGRMASTFKGKPKAQKVERKTADTLAIITFVLQLPPFPMIVSSFAVFPASFFRGRQPTGLAEGSE